MMKKITLLALLLSLCPFLAKATIVYVDSAHTGGIQNGGSWATAFSSFQSGINAAHAGDSIWVAMGTYQPALNASFSMKDSVKILGGFLNTHTSVAQRNWELNATVLKASNSRVITNDSNGVTTAALLDGFTVSNGSNVSMGGAMYNYYAAPAIRNCAFRNNTGQNAY